MPYKNPEKQRQYAKKHYKINKTRYLQSNNRRRNALKQEVRDIKEKEPCADCGLQYPHYVMDFDHLRDKEDLIKKFVHNNNRTGLYKEIDKCEIVCANCHRKRTYTRVVAKATV